TGTTTGYDVIAGGAVTQLLGTALAITGVTTINAGSNNVTLDTTSNGFTRAVEITGDVVVVDGGTTKLNIGTSAVGGDLTLISGNAADTEGITDSGVVTVGGNLSVTNDVSDGDILMDEFAVTGTISLVTSGTAGNATVTNTTGLKFADVRVGGNLDATASNGDTVQSSGEMDIDGTTIIRLGTAGKDVKLDVPSNDFTGAVSIIGNAYDVVIKDINALDLGAVTATGTYKVTAGGLITDSGAQVITGVATFVLNDDLPTLTVTSTADTLTPYEIITGGTSGAKGLVVEGAGGTNSVSYVA
ncbi:uncharacterized protein METZ01_LOCUS376050, partial [marine metagenome]